MTFGIPCSSKCQSWPQISGSVGSLSGSGVALAVGIVASLWTGLGATLAVGEALDRLWAVPRVDRPGFVSARLRGLLVLSSIGALTVVSTVVVGLATEAQLRSAAVEVTSVVAAAGVELLIFVACFRLLTSAEVSTRSVLPGAGVATIGWLVLQAIGGVYVSHVVKGSSQTYGASPPSLGCCPGSTSAPS